MYNYKNGLFPSVAELFAQANTIKWLELIHRNKQYVGEASTVFK